MTRGHVIQAQVQVTYRFSDGSGIISILALIENESENPICREQWENLGDNWVTMSNPLNNAYITQLFEFVSKVLLLIGEISCTTGFFKARDQKQIYRLNETMSHWGLNPPPPSRMRHLKNWHFCVKSFSM